MTKLKMIPTLFVAVLAVAAAWVLLPGMVGSRSSSQRAVDVTVTFAPTPRRGCPIVEGGTLTDVVTVSIMASPMVLPKERICSPKTWELMVTIGTRVDVIAEQFVGISVTCTILQSGRVKPVTQTRPRTVNCKHTVV